MKRRAFNIKYLNAETEYIVDSSAQLLKYSRKKYHLRKEPIKKITDQCHSTVILYKYQKNMLMNTKT